VANVDCGNAQATCVKGACVVTSGVNSDMNGWEDCGEREGDGKGQTGFIND